MHKRLFCQNLLNNALPNLLHKKRKACLVRFLSDLMDYDTTLSITEIGKKLTSQATVKSKLYAAHQFVNNFKLEKQLLGIYQGLAHFFWEKASEVVILIDWTGACSNNHHTLQASVVGHGRSIPLYHELHTASEQENAAVHRQFLLNLKQVLPSHLAVTIITDAGFHREWFQQVIDLGWNIIGRIYSLYCYQRDGESDWHAVKDIDFKGVANPLPLGKVSLGKTKKAVIGFLYTYKERLAKHKRKKGSPYPDVNKAFSRYYRRGWVIFSSINKPARLLVNYYKKRMQIEQNFKDIKNEQLGFGLRRNQSVKMTPVNMLIFLAVVLNMIAWWFGLMLESLNKHWDYQANSIKHKRVRSFVHLARMAFRQEPHLLEWELFLKVISELQAQYHLFIELGFLIECSNI